MRWKVAGIGLAVALLAGCGSGSEPAASGSHANDINPAEVSSLRDGGQLRIPVDALPTNYNPLQVNGARVVTWQISEAILPSAFRDGVDGKHVLAEDFFEKVELTSTAPQTVEYTIADGATWSNGRALSWEDLKSQVAALSGANPAFEGYSSVGYSSVAEVTRGDSDRKAIVTFAKPFAEWQGLFNLIVPKEITGDPDAFNTGWLARPTITAGPFAVDQVDEAPRASFSPATRSGGAPRRRWRRSSSGRWIPRPVPTHSPTTRSTSTRSAATSTCSPVRGRSPESRSGRPPNAAPGN